MDDDDGTGATHIYFGGPNLPVIGKRLWWPIYGLPDDHHLSQAIIIVFTFKWPPVS